MSLEASGHETEDRLELYALGRLPQAEAERIEEHLFWCEPCRNTLDSTADFAYAMRGELTNNPQPAGKTSFEWWSWLTAPRFAMVGALAVGLLAVGLYEVRPHPPIASLAALQLTAIRGEMPRTQAARELDLTITDAPAQGGPFRLEVVDGHGGPIWSGPPEGSPSALRIQLKSRLSAGDYFVRLYGSRGELLHEYGFRVLG